MQCNLLKVQHLVKICPRRPRKIFDLHFKYYFFLIILIIKSKVFLKKKSIQDYTVSYINNTIKVFNLIKIIWKNVQK